jgi:hypothetical protein
MTSFSVLERCLMRTALGQLWQSGNKGGTDYHLCNDDSDEFDRLIRAHAMDMNCITTPQAMNVAVNLKEQRQAKAIELLERFESPVLADKLRQQPIKKPARSWLGQFLRSMEISIRTAETVGKARRRWQFEHFSSNFPTLSIAIRVSS